MPSGSTLSVAPAALLLIVSPFPRNIFFTLKTSGSANAARRRGQAFRSRPTARAGQIHGIAPDPHPKDCLRVFQQGIQAWKIKEPPGRQGDAILSEAVILVIRNMREVTPESANRLRRRGMELQRVHGRCNVIMR